jgi:hypothetical protein
MNYAFFRFTRVGLLIGLFTLNAFAVGIHRKPPAPTSDSPAAAPEASDRLPVGFLSRRNSHIKNECEAYVVGEGYCAELQSDFNYRYLLFGLFARPEDIQDVQTAFPYSLARAREKHRENLIHCREVNVSLERWVVNGQYRALDSHIPVMQLVGLLAGESFRTGPDEYGSYAIMQSQCVPRSAEEQSLLKKFYSCLKNDDDHANAERQLTKARKKSLPTQAIEESLRQLSESRPVGCDEAKAKIDQNKIPATRFMPREEIKCVEK